LNLVLVRKIEYSVCSVLCILCKIFKRKFVITLCSHLMSYLVQSRKVTDIYCDSMYRYAVHDCCKSFLGYVEVSLTPDIYRYKPYASTTMTLGFDFDTKVDLAVAFIHKPTLFSISFMGRGIEIYDYRECHE
jgi:hypothetical protein